METANYVWILRDTSRREYYILLTVAKSQIFRVLSSEAETSSFESDDHDTSEIPCKKKANKPKLNQTNITYLIHATVTELLQTKSNK